MCECGGYSDGFVVFCLFGSSCGCSVVLFFGFFSDVMVGRDLSLFRLCVCLLDVVDVLQKVEKVDDGWDLECLVLEGVCIFYGDSCGFCYEDNEFV